MGIFSPIRTAAKSATENVRAKFGEGMEKVKDGLTRKSGGESSENANLNRAEANRAANDAATERLAAPSRAEEQAASPEVRAQRDADQIEAAKGLAALKVKLAERKEARLLKGRDAAEAKSAEVEAKAAQKAMIKELELEKKNFAQYKGLIKETRDSAHPDLEDNMVHQVKNSKGETEVFYKMGDKEFVLNNDGLKRAEKMTGDIEKDAQSHADAHIDAAMAHLESQGKFFKTNAEGKKVPLNEDEIKAVREMMHNELAIEYKEGVRSVMKATQGLTQSDRVKMGELEEDVKLLHQYASNAMELATKGKLKNDVQVLESIDGRLKEKKGIAEDQLARLEKGVSNHFDNVDRKQQAEAMWTKLTDKSKPHHLDVNNMTKEGTAATRSAQGDESIRLNKEINADVRKILLENNKTYDSVNQVVYHVKFAFDKLEQLNNFMKNPESLGWFKQQLHTRESWIQVARAMTDFGNSVVNFYKTMAELAARVAEKALGVAAAITR